MSISTTLLAPQTGTAVRLHRGQVLAIISPTGGQVADLALFDAANVLESFSPGRTIDYLERIKLGIGDSLYSQCDNELAAITRDDVGVHDMLLAPCSRAMFARRGQLDHASCHANLTESLAPFGIGPLAIVATLNVFMDVRVDTEGHVTIHPPPARAGDRFELRAQRELIVGITACSSELTNAGRCKAIAYELIVQND
ncbi:MAG TPA: urea carboxylase-associated family protein [Candidatus Acidoferrum sp.]|nr:urea carboxylase-associated family protein [Candidatus Acidoferrum sp.]